MQIAVIIRRLGALAIVAVLAACQTTPVPTATPGPTPASTGAAGSPPASSEPSPTFAPSPTAPAAAAFPLAVVTGVTNLKAVISTDKLISLASAGLLLVPCGVEVTAPVLAAAAGCVPADEIADALQAGDGNIALLPPGLVEPATKVLPIAGDGPFGLFGPDLFGDPEARALPYPVQGRATGDPVLDPAWTAYDPALVWTMTSIGSLCSDRYAAREAVTNGRGWHWAFNGGTARYKRAPRLNPDPPPGIDRNLFVEPVGTGNDGVVGQVQRRADLAIADHECPIMPTRDWFPNTFTGLQFSVPEDVLTEWQDTLGLDLVYLAANHMSDRGVAGIRSTLRLLDQHGLPRTGLGMNLDEAIEPAYLEVAGLKVAFVAVNDVGGVAKADADTAGVPWITKANINEGVRRARAAGADVIMCDPQWWGGREYHDDLLPKQVTQLAWFDAAGCDHVVGAGTHVAGPMRLKAMPDGDVSVMLASPGNYVFGQDFFQNLQEGVILEQKFVGTRLVNVRLHPYVIILGARPALTDPEGDGRYVLERIFRNSELDYRP